MTNIFPQLDPETIWHRRAGRKAFVASIHTPAPAAGPRCYVSQDVNQVTLFDGVMVDRKGTFKAHRAEELSFHWQELTEVLEGQFTVVRVTDDPPSIELLTDPLGMAHVYYLHQGRTWLISNSIYLLERISNVKALDPLAVSLFLTIDWVGADRTLRRDIRLIPGGQRLTWQEHGTIPSYQTYHSRARLARKQHRTFTMADTKRLADDLIQLCSTMNQNFGELRCPLTGGRDSRLLASLLIRASIQARYFTGGEPSATDAQIGTLIAQTFRLSHELRPITTGDVVADWDDLSRQFVRLTDGQLSLYQAADVLVIPARIDRLPVQLSGLGGEIARSFYGSPAMFIRQRSARQMLDSFPRAVMKRTELVEWDATALAQSYLQRFLQECLDEGFAALDLPDVFYTYERVRRWASAAGSIYRAIADYFIPFCSRPFLEAAFSLHPLQRYSETIHYRLIHYLAPELHRLPFGEKPWPSQWPMLTLLGFCGLKLVPYRIRVKLQAPHTEMPIPTTPPSIDPNAWFEAKLENIREVCLCQPDSSLWSFINRHSFEALMSSRADPRLRQRNRLPLFAIATMFYYEALEG